MVSSGWRISDTRGRRGNGAFLAAILAKHPALCGILFDQPHVVSGASPVLAAAGVAVRYTEYVGAAHGYISMPGLARIAEQALWEIGAELRARLWADA